MVQRTFIMLKPGAVERRLVGRILARIEGEGMNIVALKVVKLEREGAERLYEVHRGKSFFRDLVDYVVSGPVVVAVVEGVDAVRVVRRMCGVTDPSEAGVGTIRGDFGVSITKNAIHAADGAESAEREIALFFGPDEIVS
jgi:nucleoside-diphosphate kinase